MSSSRRMSQNAARAAKVAGPTAALLAIGGIAYAAQAPVSSSTITGCVAKNGELRIDSSCKKNEREISWSTVGPTGATGAAGAPGAAGADGAPGATGPAGLQGADGAPGPTGPEGAVGATGATGAAGPAGQPGHDANSPVALACDTLAAETSAQPASSVDLFLEVTGVNGGSTDAKHKGAIDITSFCWGADAGADAGTFTVEKGLGGSTVQLLDKLTSGDATTARLVTRSQATDGSFRESSISFGGVTVRGERIGGHESEPETEDVSFGWTSATMVTPGQPDVAITAPAQTTAESRPRCLTLTTTSAPAANGLSSFLTVSGISGGSTDAKHKGAIDIQGVCFGGSAAGVIDAAGKPLDTPALTSVSVQKKADVASGPLRAAYFAQSALPTATINVFKASAEPTRLLDLELSGATVDGYRSGGRGAGDHEDLSLGWSSMTVTVYTQTNTGTSVVAGTTTLTR